MKPLDKVKEKTAVFILESENETEVENFLNSVGIFEDSIITVIKNEGNSPLLIEVDGARFAISREIAKKINTSHILENQTKIFDGNQTKQREIILEILKGQNCHFSLEDILKKAQKKDKNIGQITIYRTLKTLVEKGFLETIEMPDGSKKFENIKGHHDHLICENCGSIFEFHNEQIEQLQEKVAQKHGMKIEKHTLNIIGNKCKNCD